MKRLALAAILEGMIQMQDDAKLKGQPIPLGTKAMYDIAALQMLVQLRRVP